MGVTPFVRHDDATYIYPSRLSAHVRAILESGEGAFLFIEDENAAQNIWARKRIKINAKITEIDRKSKIFETVCDLFADQHGPTMSLIRDFTDFTSAPAADRWRDGSRLREGIPSFGPGARGQRTSPLELGAALADASRMAARK